MKRPTVSSALAEIATSKKKNSMKSRYFKEFRENYTNLILTNVLKRKHAFKHLAEDKSSVYFQLLEDEQSQFTSSLQICIWAIFCHSSKAAGNEQKTLNKK